MKKMVKFGFILFGLLIVNGCLKYTYSVANVRPELNSIGQSTIAVAAQDLREYIVSGKNRPDHVGVIRATFGNPVYMYTSSQRPLSDEMGDVISGALAQKGFTAIPVPVTATEPEAEVRSKLGATGAARLVHFQIVEWKSDTWNRIRLEYTLIATVLDKAGNVLAQKEKTGDENLGGAGFNALNGTRRKVPIALKKIMEDIFNAPEIINALRN